LPSPAQHPSAGLIKQEAGHLRQAAQPSTSRRSATPRARTRRSMPALHQHPWRVPGVPRDPGAGPQARPFQRQRQGRRARKEPVAPE